MSRPKKLLFPPAMIEAAVNRLSRDLRRIHRRVRKGEILNPWEAKTLGEDAIRKSSHELLNRINKLLEKNNLQELTGDEQELRVPFEEIKKSWYAIVDDMFGV